MLSQTFFVRALGFLLSVARSWMCSEAVETKGVINSHWIEASRDAAGVVAIAFSQLHCIPKRLIRSNILSVEYLVLII
jgi:hypothetical protein